MAPSNAGMSDPFPFRNIQIDLVWNTAGMSDSDPGSLEGNIANEAREPFAAVVEVNPTSQALGAPLVHYLLQLEGAPLTGDTRAVIDRSFEIRFKLMLSCMWRWEAPLACCLM